MDGIATRLKRLREAAVPPLSVRQLAERLGVDHSTYVHYENAARFKKTSLPIELTRKLAAILADHGIDPALVMALGGVGEGEAPGLSAGEEQLLEGFRDLPPEQQRVLLQLVETMKAPPASGSVGATANSRRKLRDDAKEHV